MQVAEIRTGEDTDIIYRTYIPCVVHCMSSFAKDIPHFLDLTLDDQRILIKSCILEAAVLLDCTHVHVTGGTWQDDKLGFRLDLDESGTNLGLLGQVFVQVQPIIAKIRRLELTDVELSLLCALLLFSPGNYTIGVVKLCVPCIVLNLKQPNT
jgi:hypothetical protein